MKPKSHLSSQSELNQSPSLTTRLLSRGRSSALPLALLICLVGQQAWSQLGPARFSIWNNSTTPALISANDINSVELGLRFRSSVDGVITGIRFYKGPANTGTHVGSLWTSTGILLGSVTFTSETASGWQQQNLSSPIPISSNTTYVVSYHAPVGMYSADLDYFATAGFDNYPLRALANNEDGLNGVFTYGSGTTFPTSNFRAANYWVDVVMGIQDTNPPVISCPGDVLLECANCNTDPSNTGTATATDQNPFTITPHDVVTGTCPKVTKRTWTATDLAGNSSSCVQTITCTPASIVSDADGCTFDFDQSTAVPDFRLIFIQDPQNWPCSRIASSNPGQFAYNVFASATAGQQVTFYLTIPYPFVTQGANPIHAYDGVSFASGNNQLCLVPGNTVFVSGQQISLGSYGQIPASSVTVPVTLTVPSSGGVFLSIHLAYGLKGTGGYNPDLYNNAVTCTVPASLLIPNHGTYTFSVSGAQTDSTSIQNINAFKKIPGIAGLVLSQSTSDPAPGTAVTLKNPSGIVVGASITDEDGFYMIAYKATGKAATYNASIVTPPPVYTTSTPVPLKANSFYRVDFSTP